MQINTILILPGDIPDAYHPLDCSDITVKLCQNLDAGLNASLMMMSIGILLQFIRMLKHDDPLSNYLKDSILPELLVFMGLGMILFTRFLA